MLDITAVAVVIIMFLASAFIIIERIIRMDRRRKRETFYLDTFGDVYDIPRGKSSNREYRRRLMASISRPTYQLGRDIIPAGYEVAQDE